MLREPHKQSLKEKIELALSKQPATMQELIKLMAQEQINIVLRQNAEGRIYGITFIDNRTCCVFNGSDLGKSYSAAALQQRIQKPTVNLPEKAMDQIKGKEKTGTTGKIKEEEKELLQEKQQPKQSITELLLNPQQNFSNAPSQLMKKKRKRKKKHLGL